MVDAGLSIVRIAEFAWTGMEPRLESMIGFGLTALSMSWLEPGCRSFWARRQPRHPAWLTQQHPQMLRVDANGQRRKHGSRRQACLNNPFYRQHSVRIVAAHGRALWRRRAHHRLADR